MAMLLRNNPTTPFSRLYSLKNNPYLSDIRFIVGHDNNHTRTFYGHKALLASASSVLWDFFATGITVHRIYDIQPDSFDLFMEHIYKGEGVKKLFCGNVCGTPPDYLEKIEQIQALGYVAHKYSVMDLHHQCEEALGQFLIIGLKPGNVLSIWTGHILSYAWTHFNRPVALVEFYLDNHVQAIVKSVQFLQLSEDQLMKFLGRGSLKVENESELSDAISGWALHQCVAKGIPLTTENMRSQLGHSLRQVICGRISSANLNLVTTSAPLNLKTHAHTNMDTLIHAARVLQHVPESPGPSTSTGPDAPTDAAFNPVQLGSVKREPSPIGDYYENGVLISQSSSMQRSTNQERPQNLSSHDMPMPHRAQQENHHGGVRGGVPFLNPVNQRRSFQEPLVDPQAAIQMRNDEAESEVSEESEDDSAESDEDDSSVEILSEFNPHAQQTED